MSLWLVLYLTSFLVPPIVFISASYMPYYKVCMGNGSLTSQHFYLCPASSDG